MREALTMMVTGMTGMLMVVAVILLYWILKILKARGLASPHVIVSTGNGGVMKGMKLDISGPGYEDDPLLYVRTGCNVIGCVFSHAGGIQQKSALPVIDYGKCSMDADPMQEGYVRKGGMNPPCPDDAVRPPPPGARDEDH